MEPPLGHLCEDRILKITLGHLCRSGKLHLVTGLQQAWLISYTILFWMVILILYLHLI